MIRFEHMSKYYPTKSGKAYVFKDVNCILPMDKSIGVLGPNGVGKSTLIRMIGGADIPSRGEIHSQLNISWPLGLQGGMQGSMTGRENARFVARIHGYKDTRQIEKKVEDFAEIGRYYDEPVKSYSNGMRARVAFGLSMSFDFDFDVLLIDELNAVGDLKFRQKSEAILREKYQQTRLIMVNHGLPQLKKFCEAGLLLRNQGIEYFESIDDAIEEYKYNYESAS